MSDDFTFDLLDPHGSAEVEDQPTGAPRRDFLRRLVVGGGALTIGGTLVAEFAPAASAASVKTDITILNAALILEELGVNFYAQAMKHARLTGETRTFVSTVHSHEVAHAAFVKQALGRHAKPVPTYSFGSRTHSQSAVQKNAMAIEGLCTAALVGVAPLLTRKTLKSAGALLPVEAQHVAWISNIIGASPAPSPFNVKDTIPGVEKTIAPLIAKSGATR